jgi:uncharacterized membrane protein YczE
MSTKELVKRTVFMLSGICVTSFGLEVAVKADLGLSPLTTLAYAMHNVFPGISLGVFTFLQQCCFVLLTFLLLRQEFKLYLLLMLPCSFLYGYAIDLSAILLKSIPVPDYLIRMVLLLASCVIIAFGFSMILNSGVCLDANTTFVNALSKKTSFSYSKLKVLTDVIIVALATFVALAALHSIAGIREGTVISAVIIGPIVGFFSKYLSKMERCFTSS